MRSTPRCCPRLFSTDTAPGWLVPLRNAVFKGFQFRGAEPARALSRSELADRQRSTHCVLRTWRCCLRGQLAMRSTPRCWSRLLSTDTTPGRRVRASKRRNQRFLVPWCVARARFTPWRTSRPPLEHALHAADLARLSSQPTGYTRHPMTLAEALLYRRRATSSAAA